jgi:hypothetical protein
VPFFAQPLSPGENDQEILDIKDKSPLLHGKSFTKGKPFDTKSSAGLPVACIDLHNRAGSKNQTAREERRSLV